MTDEGRYIKYLGTYKSRKLRQESTPAEVHLWSYLRARRLNGFKFKRQFRIGPYIADFVCLSKKLVLELDGSHHLEQEEYDLERTQYMEHFGFRVLRFWNHDVLNNLPAVLERILQETNG